MFNPLSLFKRKQLLYKSVFNSRDGQQVLSDLAVFCHADSSTFNENPYVTAERNGRRAVILHIMSTLKINLNDIGEPSNGYESEYPY